MGVLRRWVFPRYIISRTEIPGKITQTVPELKCRYRMMNECWTKVILVDRIWCHAIFVLQVINWNVTLDGRRSPNFVWRRCSVLSMMKQNRPYWKLAWKAGPRCRGVRRPDPVVFWRYTTRKKKLYMPCWPECSSLRSIEINGDMAQRCRRRHTCKTRWV